MNCTIMKSFWTHKAAKLHPYTLFIPCYIPWAQKNLQHSHISFHTLIFITFHCFTKVIFRGLSCFVICSPHDSSKLYKTHQSFHSDCCIIQKHFHALVQSKWIPAGIRSSFHVNALRYIKVPLLKQDTTDLKK